MMRRLLSCFRSPLFLLAGVVLVLAGLLWLDVQRVTARVLRVAVADPAAVSLVEEHLPFTAAYVSTVVDAVPRVGGLVVLPRFQRSTQIILVTHCLRFSPGRRLGLIASHVPVWTKSRDVKFGLDRAAQEWLGVGLEKATAKQIEEGVLPHVHASAVHRRAAQPQAGAGKGTGG